MIPEDVLSLPGVVKQVENGYKPIRINGNLLLMRNELGDNLNVVLKKKPITAEEKTDELPDYEC